MMAPSSVLTVSRIFPGGRDMWISRRCSSMACDLSTLTRKTLLAAAVAFFLACACGAKAREQKAAESRIIRRCMFNLEGAECGTIVDFRKQCNAYPSSSHYYH